MRLIDDTAFSNAGASILDATAANQQFAFLVPNITARTYDVRIGVKKINTRGTVQVAIGPAGSNTPTNQGAVQDLYNPTATFVELDINPTWTPGSNSDKWVWFTVTGKNASSSGFTEAIDYIKLIPQ